jgi:hypothetical protein
MGWCETNHVDYVFGLTRNPRLRKIIGPQMRQAHIQHLRQICFPILLSVTETIFDRTTLNLSVT